MEECELALNDKTFHSWRLSTGTAGKTVAVLLHGAGTSDSTRAVSLAEDFAAAGIPVVSLDFFGHGKTGGELAQTSLTERINQAETAITFWTKPDDTLIICGFSMSGHVVLRLTESLGDRVQSIGLFCPAVYAKEAEDVPFGPAFSEIIRRPHSWQNSLALEVAAKFKGRALIFISADDEVIPWPVVAEIASRLRISASDVRLQLVRGARHQLMQWLASQPEHRKSIVNYLK